MSITLNSSSEIPWWKEPSKEQWKAWIAAWQGWTLDAFDFTIFLLIMVPIAKEFDVPLLLARFPTCRGGLTMSVQRGPDVAEPRSK
jgi:MFS transporter, SHS family, lactate transporter